MKVTVEVGNTGVQEWCRMGERLIFGSSAGTQTTVDDTELGSQHFSIEARPDGCWLECHAPHTVTVNGQLVNQTIRLRSDDCIRAGNTGFRIRIENDFVEEEFGEPEEIEQTLCYSQSTLKTGVVVLEASKPLATPSELVLPICRNYSPFVLVNYRRARLELPPLLTEADDFFQQAPAEIRQEHSLHLVAATSCEEALEAYMPLRSLDAAQILFARKTREKLLDCLKFQFAWYASPGVFHFHMEAGTRDLARRILAGVDAVFAEPADGSGWWLITNQEARYRLAEPGTSGAARRYGPQSQIHVMHSCSRPVQPRCRLFAACASIIYCLTQAFDESLPGTLEVEGYGPHPCPARHVSLRKLRT